MYWSKVIQIIYVILAFACWCDAKIYSKCEFAKAMKKNGVTSLADLGTWTCIAQHESNFNTKAVNQKTGDYGILQINHKYWCSDTSKPGKGCNITCKSLLGDDITEDIKCARHIFSETQRQQKKSGFTAWVAYKYCTGNQSKYISGCNV